MLADCADAHILSLGYLWFYAESIKHGVKALTPSVNHTIGIRYSERRLVIEWGGFQDINFVFQG